MNLKVASVQLSSQAQAGEELVRVTSYTADTTRASLRVVTVSALSQPPPPGRSHRQATVARPDSESSRLHGAGLTACRIAVTAARDFPERPRRQKVAEKIIYWARAP